MNCDHKVAIIGRLDQPGGVQSVILSLIDGLNRAGIIPDVIWDLPPNHDLLRERSLLAGYLPVSMRFSSKTLDRFPVTIRYLLRAFNSLLDTQVQKLRKYDFYYIFYNGFLVSSQVNHLRYLSGPPLLPQLDTYSPGLRGIPYRVIRHFYKRFLSSRYPVYEFHRNDRYVINSNYTQELFLQAHGVKLPVVHPPVLTSMIDILPDDLSRRSMITFFSRFASYKRPEMVIELASRYPDLTFLLMGGVKSNMEVYYQSLVDSASRLANVRFIKTPSLERIRKELSRTRFYIFPGVNEHFGMTTVEAISAGAVPYVHNSGGQREIVPEPILRFDDETFFSGFNQLYKLPLRTLVSVRQQLFEHIQQYSEEAFQAKMLAYLPFYSGESERLHDPEAAAL
jgi:glycosyltransferase involved in cell wall biosynthesis